MGVGRDLRQHRHQRVGRVEHRAAVEARVQVALGGAHLHRRLHEAARRQRDRGRALVDHQRVEHDRAVGVVLAGPEPLQHRGAADLLLALDQEAHVHGQLARPGKLARHVQQRQEVALVVGRAARVDAPVALGRLERRALPQLQRAGCLNVVVAVGEHGGRAGARRAQLADGHRVAAVHADGLRAAAGRLDPLADPVAGARQGRAVTARRRDGRDPQPVVELFAQRRHRPPFWRK